MTTLLHNVGELITNDPAADDLLGVVTDAALVIDDGRVAWVGPSAAAPSADEAIDCDGAAVMPGFVDSHAHLVFAGDRSAEFAARMAGQPYAAGGIRTTVAATRAASDEELRARVAHLVGELERQGSTTYEIKSGYGLTTPDEARSLRIAAEFTDETTYLGAHVVPPEFDGDRSGYIDLVCGDMLDACAPHARWADVFCDRGAFDADETTAILTAAQGRGLMPRVHANQLQHGPGVQVAVEVGAASADHCTHLSDADVALLADSDTVATLLPGAEFSTRAPFPDARRLIDAGVTVALATDCNPGSSYTTSMPFCIAVGVRDMHFTVAEALWSATAGGATALRRTDVGGLTPGQRADLMILNAPSALHLAYRPGVDLIAQVWREGERIR